MIATLDKVWVDMKERNKNTEFLPTGFSHLDQNLDGGFLRKELVVLGGFTGGGKSYLAGQWARNISSRGFKTIYFSLEISNETLLSRMVGQVCNLKATKIMCGLLSPGENQLAMKGKAKLADSNPYLHLCDSIYKLKEIEDVVREGKYEFVVIDFVQNIMADKKDEYSNMTYVSLALQKLAKECNCCIMILSQLSNSANKSDGVLEYKGSGGIAMVADLGFFIVREPYPSTKMSLQLRKNRRGMYGNIDLVMRGEGCLIEEYYGQQTQ